MTDRNESLPELLIRQESKVAELHRLFSERDPEHRDFRRSMANAELQHVSMIQELQGNIPSRQALLIEGKVRIDLLPDSRTFLKLESPDGW